MRHSHSLLRASLAIALAAASAQTSVAGSAALIGVNTAEPARVVQVVDSRFVTTVQNSHLKQVDGIQSLAELADSAPMNHLQLVLHRSGSRQAVLDSLMADQHNPASPRFRQWLTPQEFGDRFGVVDSDIAAAKVWLVSQGFKVNGVYPNKMQIDFSGTAGMVRNALHTQENRYRFKDGNVHVANAGDITLPVALREVAVGVVGLNDLQPRAMHEPAQFAQLDPTTHLFQVQHSPMATGIAAAHPDAIVFSGGERGLVPYDLDKMYAVDQLHAKGIDGQGVTIAVVEEGSMVPADWSNFVAQFSLGSYGGTFAQIQPQAEGFSNCVDPTIAYPGEDFLETILDAEWSTAIAPGAHIEVASCTGTGQSSNVFGGVFIAAINLINGTQRPNVISASYGYGEDFVDAPSKTAIDRMWEQADAEGISVFVSSGDSGSNPDYNGQIIQRGISANALGTSPHVTVVGGLDTADVLAGTTSQYFAAKPNAVYGTVLSYVPEIPWNMSCSNPLAAKAKGFLTGLDFCRNYLKKYHGEYATSEAGSGGPSSIDPKPAWQSEVYNAQNDGWRDVPDVALFAGAFGDFTRVIVCTSHHPCAPGFPGKTALTGGTSLSTPMFAGIQALVIQGLGGSGSQAYLGNAAPTLYALAAAEYGGPGDPAVPTLTACSSDKGTSGTTNCVFHNITTGGISTQCEQYADALWPTPDCFFYGTFESDSGSVQIGLTSTDATRYGPLTIAFPSRPGWSFAAGLGSVNATNLLAAWQIYANGH